MTRSGSAEGAEQGLSDPGVDGVDILLTEPPAEADDDPPLLQCARAPGAARQMTIDCGADAGWQGAVEIIGDDLDELAAGDVAGTEDPHASTPAK